MSAENEGEGYMKKIILSLYIVMLAFLATSNMGCYAEVRGPRWHYDHDYDDGWRAHHRWHEERGGYWD
jgi:hypothetical protein